MDEEKQPTAEQILTAATVTKRQSYEIEGAGKVWIHRLVSHDARLLFNSMDRDDDGKIIDAYDDAKVILKCVRDKNGKQVFEQRHLPRIAGMGNDVVMGLVGACLKINGMGAAGREEIVKNSEPTLGSDSSSE